MTKSGVWILDWSNFAIRKSRSLPIYKLWDATFIFRFRGRVLAVAFRLVDTWKACLNNRQFSLSVPVTDFPHTTGSKPERQRMHLQNALEKLKPATIMP